MEKSPRRDIGAGSLFQQKGCQRWYIQYYVDGRRVRERTGLASRRRAQELLTERLAQVRKGEWTAPRKPPRMAELYRLLEDHTRVHCPPRALRDLRTRWGKQDEKQRWHGHLVETFADMLAINVSTETLTAYARKRQEEGAANATINREFAALRRMFNLARRSTPPRVHDVPHFPMLKENNTRTGFVEDADFAQLAANATELWLRVFLELAFTYGWRRGELLGLRVRQVNFEQRAIRLDPGSTKNREGREVAMTPKVCELLRSACQGKGPDDRVLTRSNGRAVREFREAWRNLCVRAGLGQFVCRKCETVAALEYDAAYQCPQCKTARRRDLRYVGRIPHDMRRSAAKALRRAGVPESVIMATGGWKTAAMFRRYAIVSSADQRDAMEMLEAARAKQRSLNSALIAPTRDEGDANDVQQKPQ